MAPRERTGWHSPCPLMSTKLDENRLQLFQHDIRRLHKKPREENEHGIHRSSGVALHRCLGQLRARQDRERHLRGWRVVTEYRSPIYQGERTRNVRSIAAVTRSRENS